METTVYKLFVRFSGVFGVLSSITGLFGSQVRAVLRVSSVWSSFVDYWTFPFSGESCASCFKCLEFVRRLLDFSVFRGELCFVFQVFGVRSSIIGLFRSQGRHCFVFGWDLTGLTELFHFFRSPGERCFVFEIICTLQLKAKCLFDHCLLLANLNKVPRRPCQKLTLELI